ncbi:T9SS type A sorting domain-containing protein [Hymenobacter chitinivorans]|uniref:Putative secreted protein (Por secretion system target) n=1 Tax=Hymenobacter chitinivorans DSM 11115 TaxID=1121954 RepID=A0A2M9B4L0_9BACT|nr:T9SS type A sorting domain-containing protein [Hymenobacter chitinivorans]PJJ52866.1 putative secreted protein (Por secretion system target) [Hymenobacter chitinivorans DSM 11115]
MRNSLLTLGLTLGLAVSSAYAQTPSWQGGAQNVNPAPTNDTESQALAISADASGNAYVGGTLTNGRGSGVPGVRSFGSTVLTNAGNGFGTGFIGKLSTSQQWQWAVPVSNNGEGTYITHTAATPAGDVYASGFIEELGNTTLKVGSLTQAVTATYGAYFTRLNTSGQPQWIAVASLSGATSTSSVSVVSMNWDATNGNLVVVGEYEGGAMVFGSTTLPSAPKGGIFVAKLSAAGQWLSAVGVAATGASANLNVDAAAAGYQGQVAVSFSLTNGSIALGSLSVTSSSSADEKNTVAQLSSTGQWQWLAQPQGVTASFELDDLTYDRNGNIWTMGSASTGAQLGTSTIPANSEEFVARLTSAGQWGAVGNIVRQTSGPGFAIGSQITADAQGNVLVAGDLEYRTNNDTYAFGSTTLSTAGSTRNFMARFSPAGQWQFAQLSPASPTAAASSNYTVEDMTLDGIGNLLTAGRIRRGSVTFDVTTLTGSQGGDAYVAKLANAGVLTVRQAANAAPLALYPNPTPSGAAFTLRLSAATTGTQAVVLRDALGRVARQVTLVAGQSSASISTAGLTPGLYLVEAGASRAQVVVE